jgi:APA family basic amino acid/polyamine antiporter
VVVLVLTSTFETVITYLSFTLAMSTFMTVVGVFVRRWKHPHLPRPFSTWGYPVTPLVFLATTGWMLVYLLRFRPVESLAGLATIGLGLVVYLVGVRNGGPAASSGQGSHRGPA